MENNNNLKVFTYYWKTREITEQKNFHSELRIYGVTEDNRNVCVRVEDCKTRIYLEFLDYDYLTENFQQVKNILSTVIFSDMNSVKLVKKKKLYGGYFNEDLTQKLFPFVEISFSTVISMYHLRKKLKDLDFPCQVKIHELEASTELQFMTERKITPCGWIEIPNWERYLQVNQLEKVTTCDIEILVGKNNVYPCQNELSSVSLKIMAWDIEAKCMNIGKNPGNSLEDCVFQISCIFYRGKERIYRKVLLTLGLCNKFSDDVEIKIYETEKDLILGFSELIREERPNILTGWNIFNFDTTFMLNRAQRHMIMGEFCTFGFTEEPGNVVSIKWSSSAFNITDIQYLDVEGVLSIDLIEAVRKEYKLDNYKLDTVAEHFLKEKKDDISFKDLMYAYDCFLKRSENLAEEFSRVGKYCIQDSVLVIELFEKLQTWLSLSAMSTTTSTPVMVVHLHGQQRKFYNQIYKYCYHNNILVESNGYQSKPTDRYTGAYVFDPVPGLYEYVSPLDFASLYPSIIIAYNLDYTTWVSEETVKKLPENSVHLMEWEDHHGCEHDILVQQKNSLNILIDSCTDSKEKKKLCTERANVIKKINKNIICQKNKYYFLKPHIVKGILPTIIQNLLDARKEVRKQMKTVTGDTWEILNQRQLSYKVSANSMYGATGVKSGALPFMPLAMCVTYTGRESIQKAAKILKSLGGTIVYGDTDSNYVMFRDIQGTHEEKCKAIWEKATNVANEISSYFPPPMRIEFEEVIYSKFMILTKKRYMYYSCNQDGKISPKIGKKGVLLNRRDNSKLIKDVYEEVVMRVFNGESIDTVTNAIFRKVFDLISGRINPADLKITKVVNDYNDCKMIYDEKNKKYRMGNYIVPGLTEDLAKKRLPAQVQLEIKMVERGEGKAEGNRIEYIVLEKEGVTKQSEKIENFKYFLENQETLNIDYKYYITRLIEPLEQIFTSIYLTEPDYIKTRLTDFIKMSQRF